MDGRRSDIDGLRGIAVAVVLLYHVDPRWMPAGFIGVDVFFVLSGYLITRMIVAERDTFSFLEFYRRRFYRLYPALQATLIGTLIAGWWIYGPQDYVALAWTALTAAVGISNIHFLFAVDYFNASALQHPLLHTWSLGVEEQFYLVWPALLVLWLGRRWPLVWLAAAAAAVSLVLIWSPLPAKPDFAFYLMPFRMFEFAIGAALFALEPRLRRLSHTAHVLIGGLGVVLLGAALVVIDKQTRWPGLWTLAPTMATAALIVAGQARFWGRALSVLPLRFLGRISYSLYLVHWPLIVLYLHHLVTPPTLLDRAILLAGSIGLGWLLHAIIEQPFRSATPQVGPLRLPRMPTIALGAATLGALFVGVMATAGFPARLDRARVQTLDQGLTFAGDLCSAQRSRCTIGDRSADRTVYLVGDSHALNLVYGLDQHLRERGLRGIVLYNHGCLFAYGTLLFAGGRIDEGCRRNVTDSYELLASNRDPVIIAGDYASYRATMGPDGASSPLRLDEADYFAWLEERFLAGLHRIGGRERRIIMVKQSYDTGISLPRCLSRPALSPEAAQAACQTTSRSLSFEQARAADRMIERIATATPTVTILDPKHIFCRQERCSTEGADGLFFRDENHLTNAGSTFLIGGVQETLSKAIAPQR